MHRQIKTWLWLYIILLIFEGALRKWIFPDLSAALLLVRDPIAVWLTFLYLRESLAKTNIYVACLTLVSFISVTAAVTVGHGNFPVALYGARIYVIHFPLIFVFGKYFSKVDAIGVGKVLVYLSLPMTVLLAFQFFSPQSAWVNRGIGHNFESGGFSGALGFYRPPGTFSFTNGVSCFYGIVAAYILYFWLNPSPIRKSILVISSVMLLAALPLSISRSLIFSVAISCLATILAAFFNRRHLIQVFKLSLTALSIFIVLSFFSFFQKGIEVLAYRFETAAESEGGANGITNRILSGFFSAFNDLHQVPFWGVGMGLGTNVASQLLYGKSSFLVAEDEWGRIIGESGIVLGILIIAIRLTLAFKFIRLSVSNLRINNTLPCMVLSFCFPLLIQGQWSQPTALGFAIVGAGLFIASNNIETQSQ